jgi:hypothetical protein
MDRLKLIEKLLMSHLKKSLSIKNPNNSKSFQLCPSVSSELRDLFILAGVDAGELPNTIITKVLLYYKTLPDRNKSEDSKKVAFLMRNTPHKLASPSEYIAKYKAMLPNPKSRLYGYLDLLQTWFETRAQWPGEMTSQHSIGKPSVGSSSSNGVMWGPTSRFK